MNLTEIRERQAKVGTYRHDISDLWRNWLARDCSIDFKFGLTVMPEKKLVKHLAGVRNVNGNKAYRHMTRAELEQALKKLVELLNRLIYKNAYRRYGKKLEGIMVIEGEQTGRDLHAHLALNKPDFITIKQFTRLVRRALELSGEFLINDPTYNANTDNLDKRYRYKLDIIDRDWLYYITKELNKLSVHNLHFI